MSCHLVCSYDKYGLKPIGIITRWGEGKRNAVFYNISASPG